MMIDWVGNPYFKEGYGIHNKELLKQFAKKSCDGVKIGHLVNIVENIKVGVDKLSSIGVACVPVPAVVPPWEYSILYTTIETQSLHEGWIARAGQWDEIWVPSDFCRSVLQKTKLKIKPIFVMPEGVDSTIWYKPVSKVEDNGGVKINRFLFHGVWHWRRGSDILLKIWKEFAGRDDCELVIVARVPLKSVKESRDIIWADIKKYCGRSNNDDYFHVEVITDILSQEEIVKYFQSSDVFLCPSRGEAWGLPIIQAMSCGLLCIVPDRGGHRAFVNDKNSILVSGYVTDFICEEIDFYHDFHYGQKWYNSSVGEYIFWMKKFIERPDVFKKTRDLASAFVGVGFGWDRAAEKIISRLEQLDRG